jgi:hypothetical protein
MVQQQQQYQQVQVSRQSIVLPNGQSQNVVKNSYILFLNKGTLERSKNGGKGDLPVA